MPDEEATASEPTYLQGKSIVGDGGAAGVAGVAGSTTAVLVAIDCDRSILFGCKALSGADFSDILPLRTRTSLAVLAASFSCPCKYEQGYKTGAADIVPILT